MRVLLSAYSCRVGEGSEPGQGWGWARALSEAGHHVTVLTRPKNRNANEAWLAGHSLPGLRFVYVPSPVSGRVERHLGKQGDYLAWSRMAHREARRLHSAEVFDVVHHVTFGTVLLGSPMWRLGIPFIYGPLGGGQQAPAAAAAMFGDAWRKERLRNHVVAGTIVNPIARPAVRHAAVVLVTNEDTARVVRQIGARQIEWMSDTGIADELIGRRRSSGPGRRLIWVGSDRPRKGLSLAMEAFAELRRVMDAQLVVVGPARERVETLAKRYDVGGSVAATGKVSWESVQAAYRDSDLMLFTSLRESFGGQLVEAAAAGLPIIGMDLHGLTAIVPTAAAIKVPLTSESARRIAAAAQLLLNDPARWAAMSKSAVAFAEDQTWSRRAATATAIYENACSRS